jgi:ABC-2 type transport system permease protein
MNKINAVIKREYLTRVKKKSFIILTLLIPILIAGLMVVPILMMNMSSGKPTNIIILDESGLMEDNLYGGSAMRLLFTSGDIEELKNTYNLENDALLHIPDFDLRWPGGVRLYADKQISMSQISNLERQISNIIEDARFANEGIDKETVDKLRTRISIETILITGDVEKAGNVHLSIIIGQAMSLFLYFMIFMYGSMVMKCVMDEKKNRIIEILASSLRPFELMIGKIIGIAAVAITQLFIWIAFGILAITVFLFGIAPNMLANTSTEASLEMLEEMSPQQTNMVMEIVEFFNDPGAINIPLILFTFIFYFIFGYLFYSTLFAGVGSVSDDEHSAQTFTLPIMAPIMISVFISMHVIDSPHSPLAVWASIIPFSSPIVMLARIPFVVPAWQILVSMLSIIIFFVGSTWVAGKIYRTGILLYGKKLTWKDLWKFIRV